MWSKGLGEWLQLDQVPSLLACAERTFPSEWFVLDGSGERQGPMSVSGVEPPACPLACCAGVEHPTCNPCFTG